MVPQVALFLDDDADKRFLVCHQLRREFPNLEVRSFHLASEAIVAVAEKDINVVMTDGRLAGDAGLAFGRRVRALLPRMPIIIVSLREELRDSALKAGFQFVPDGDRIRLCEAMNLALAPA